MDSEMLEIETLGPPSRLGPGTSVEHVETLELLRRSYSEREDDIDALSPQVDRSDLVVPVVRQHLERAATARDRPLSTRAPDARRIAER